MEEKKVLKHFRAKKILTVEELAHLLRSSAITARRRLKKWNTYTSINFNGRYYVLPEVAEFDENGLWIHLMVFFSKQGNLRETIVQLINNSEAGLTIQEVSKLVGLRANSSFPSRIRDVSGIHREKRQGRFVYFSDKHDTYLRQKQHREHLLEFTKSYIPSRRQPKHICSNFVNESVTAARKSLLHQKV